MYGKREGAIQEAVAAYFMILHWHKKTEENHTRTS
jgi:hypothetical protein